VYAGPYWLAEEQDAEWFREWGERLGRAKIAEIHAAAQAAR
jgi:hypothetical protein